MGSGVKRKVWMPVQLFLTWIHTENSGKRINEKQNWNYSLHLTQKGHFNKSRLSKPDQEAFLNNSCSCHHYKWENERNWEKEKGGKEEKTNRSIRNTSNIFVCLLAFLWVLMIMPGRITILVYQFGTLEFKTNKRKNVISLKEKEVFCLFVFNVWLRYKKI